MKSFWIKERHNPQLGVYYVPMGQMLKKDVKPHERALHGENYMLEFKDLKEYQDKLEQLKNSGAKVQA